MCTLTITSVTPVYSQGVLSQVTVVGATTDCDVVNVQLRCKTLTAVKKVTIGPGNVYTATFPAAELKAAGCECGGTVTVDVTCSNGRCKAPPWTGKLQCCQEITVSAVVGECDKFGKRVVKLVAHNPGSTSVAATWAYGDTFFGTQFTLAPGATHTEQHSYLPGSYTAAITITGCPPQNLTVNVPGCCPALSVSAQVGPCNPDGTRTVTLYASNAGPSAGGIFWIFGDSSPNGPSFSLAAGTANATTHNYLPGSYTATLKAGKCPGVTVAFQVPGCCPAITVSAQMGTCKPDGTRTVTLHASNAGPAANGVYWVFGESPPQVGSPFSLGVGATNLTSHDYMPGTYTATLVVGECPGVPVTFTVEPCCPRITVSAMVGDCTPDGTRLVTLQATNAGPPANGIYWMYGDGSPNGSPFSLGVGTTNTSTHGYAPKTPGSYTATLKIPGCPDVPVTFDVPPCCPTVTISATVGACNAGKRDVTLHASSTGPGTVNVYWKFGDGSQDGAVFSLGPNASGSEQHTYGAGPYTATLILPDCPAQSLTLNVADCPPCPECPPCPPGCTSIPDLPPGCTNLPGCPAGCVPGCAGCLGCGGSCMGCLCRILCLLWIILLAGYLFGIATGALANVVALIITTLVLILFAWLYITLCKLCSLVKCTWIALLVFLVLVVLALVFGLVLVGLGPALLVAAGIFVAALLVNYFFCTGKIGF